MRPDIQQHRLPERRAGVSQHHPGDIGQVWVKLHIVQVQQLGVFLFQLQSRLAPGAHLLQFAAQVLILGSKALITLEIGHQIGHACDRGHGPFQIGHHGVNHRRAHPLDPRAVDPPQGKNADQHQNQQPDQQSADRAGVILAVLAVSGQGRSLCRCYQLS